MFKSRRMLLAFVVVPLSVFGLCCALLLYFTLRVVGTHRSPELLSPASYAPDFSLPDHTGRVHRYADYKGRPIILAFLSRKSPVFEAALQSLKATMPDFDKTGAKTFAISDAPQVDLNRIHELQHLNYPILRDDGLKLARRYGAVNDSGSDLRNVCVVIDETSRVVIAIPVSDAHVDQLGFQLMNMAACCLNPASTPLVVRAGERIDPISLPDAVTSLPVQVGTTTSSSQVATVIEFLSAKCPCSLGYDARIESLFERYQAKGIRFIAINSSFDETAIEEQDHLRHAGLKFPVLMDRGNLVADQMKAKVTPEFFVVDRKLVIRYHGRLDDSRDPASVTTNSLQIALDELLAGKHVAEPEGHSIGCAIMRVQNAKL